MKHTVEGFQQKKMIEAEIDIIDGAILRWFIDFKEKGKMVKHLVHGETYFWVNYEKIVKDYPVIKLTKETVGKRMRRMAKLGILKHHTVKNGGTFSCYTVGNKYNQLIRSNDKNTESEEIDSSEVMEDCVNLKEERVDIKKSTGCSFKAITKDSSIKNILLLNKSKQSETNSDSDWDKSLVTKPSIVKEICKEYGIYPDKSFIRVLSMYKFDDLCEILKRIPKEGIENREAYLRRILKDQPKAVIENSTRKDQIKEEIIQSPVKDEMTKEALVTFDNISNLTDKEKTAIEERAYVNFLMSINSNDNKISRGIFEKCKNFFISQELHSMIEKGLISEVDLNKEKLGA